MKIRTFNKDKEIIYTDNILEADLITHSGTMHADDIFSTVLLLNVIDKDIIKITRTNETKIDSMGICYDIGGGSFDHHQIEGNGIYENGIKKASFGLLWEKFGYDFLKEKTSNSDFVFKQIKEKLIYNFDAVDNGQLETTNNYNITVMDLPSIFDFFNSNWNEDIDQNLSFLEAVSIGSLLFNKIVSSVISKSDAKIIVDQAIENSSGGLMILDTYIPWKEFVINSDNPKAKDILYVIYPDNRSAYALKGVPVENNSFQIRKKLPSSWAGLRDEELAKVTKVDSAAFCHNALFLCCANTKEGIIQLANIAIENKEYDK